MAKRSRPKSARSSGASRSGGEVEAGRSKTAVPPRPSQQRRPSQARIARQRKQQQRRRRGGLRWGGAILVAAALAGVIAVVVAISSGSPAEVIPPAVTGGATTVEPAALEVSNPSGISGVVAYDATGWPTASNNGPTAKALGHNHVDGPVEYSVIPPVGGDHNAQWMNCGVYDQPVPSERAVHNLEHGAVWITYQPSLSTAAVQLLRAFDARQSVIRGSRYVDLSPYPGLPAPIVISSWGHQLRVTSPTDPRLPTFVDKFRASQTYSPEYGGPCTGGVGTPLVK